MGQASRDQNKSRKLQGNQFLHIFQTGLAPWENGDREASIHAFRGRPAYPRKLLINPAFQAANWLIHRFTDPYEMNEGRGTRERFFTPGQSVISARAAFWSLQRRRPCPPPCGRIWDSLPHPTWRGFGTKKHCIRVPYKRSVRPRHTYAKCAIASYILPMRISRDVGVTCPRPSRCQRAKSNQK